MDFLLSSSTDKREKDAAARREAAKEKKRRELMLAEEQARRAQQSEALRLARKEEEAKRVAEVSRLQEEERTLTGGMSFLQQNLTPYRIAGEDDKVLLPESCLVELNQVDAFSRGPVLLRIWSSRVTQDTPSTSANPDDVSVGCTDCHYYTHCGIREFSAAPGTIGIPDKVIQSLLIRCGEASTAEGDDDNDSLSLALQRLQLLSVKYVQLPKVTYACLRPLRNSFQAVGPVKECLEENLRYHSALSVGDLITVWHRGRAHQLRVQRMSPAAHGTLIQTDVVIDLDTSEEHLSAAKAQASVEALSVRPALFAQTAPSPAIVAPSPAMPEEETIELPEEPPQGSADVVACRLRVPNGATLTRRYRRSDALTALFELAARNMRTRRDGIQLSTRFPTRVFEYKDIAESKQTLEQAGITENQVFLVSAV